MKKFAKMSLVAAVAVAGMTSTVSAKDLTEAIKGVDVSGTVVYRYDDKQTDTVGAASSTNNNYKIGMTVKSPVNDDVTATTRFIVGGTKGGFAALQTNQNADSNVDVELSWVNFAYTGLANTTVVVGKQGIATPWTNAIDSDGNEETGTGILAMTTMGPVTAAAGYFNQTNFEANLGLGGTADDVAVAALMAKFAGVNLEAWYLDVADAADSYFLGANYSFNAGDVKIGLDGKYTAADLDNDSPDADLGNWEVGITAKMGMFNAGVAYAESEKDGDAIFNSVAKNGQIGYSVNLNNGVESDMIMVDLGAQVTPELHIGLNYDEVDQKSANTNDHEEAFVQVTYKMSKNFTTYVRLADGEENNVDYNRGRLQVQYSF